MKKSYQIVIFLFLLLTVFSFVDAAGGSGPDLGGGGSAPTVIRLENPFKLGNDLYSFIKAIINNIILPLGGMLCVLAFIYSGFIYVTAQGDNAKIKKAHTALLYSAIGTAILLGAWAIANAIESTINQLSA